MPTLVTVSDPVSVGQVIVCSVGPPPSWRGCGCCVRLWAPLAPTWPTWTPVWPSGCEIAYGPAVSPFHPAAFQVRYCMLSTRCAVFQHVVQFSNRSYNFATGCAVFQQVVQFTNRLCSFPIGCPVYQQIVEFSNRSYNFATDNVRQICNRFLNFAINIAAFYEIC